MANTDCTITNIRITEELEHAVWVSAFASVANRTPPDLWVGHKSNGDIDHSKTQRVDKHEYRKRIAREAKQKANYAVAVLREALIEGENHEA